MAKSLEAGACDYGMPDAIRSAEPAGDAASLAESHNLLLVSHVFLEISAHLLCVTSSAYRLEHLDKARPILEQPLKVKEGHALVPEGSGIGLDWNENAVERFLVE